MQTLDPGNDTTPTRSRYVDLPTVADTGEHHAWNIFGKSDEVGTLNLIDAAAIAAAASLVRDGVVIDLSLPLDAPSPSLSGVGRGAYEHYIDRSRNGRDDHLSNFYLQGSTQWDGLPHVRFREFGYYGGRDEDALDRGELGIENAARKGIVGRGILADFARSRTLTPTERYGINAEDLESLFADAGCVPCVGDILLVRTGWLDWYLNLTPEGREKMRGALGNRDDPLRCVGLDPSKKTAEWLWDNGIAAVVADNPAVEALPVRREEGFLHRRLIPLLGMLLGEFWNLEELSAYCSSHARYEFLFVSAPLKLPRGVGSPGNGYAIL